MKKFLVLSDPPTAPGYLPRLRYLCDYLVQRGYDVTLVTERYEELPFEHTYPIETISMYNGSICDWTLKTIWTLLTDWHNRVFAKRAIKQLSDKTFDYVLCTAFSDFPLGAARRMADFYGVPLICDIRDLDEQVDNSRYQYNHRKWWTMPFRRVYRAIHIRRRNQVLKSAKAIMTVSPWHSEFIKHFNTNVITVYNGFDDKQFFPEDIPATQFTISYIGSLFEWQQPALVKVQQAIQELQLPIILDIHTPQSRPIPYTQLGEAIRQSSIMLVLTSAQTHGMMTTKFYEALGCEKPVLCVPSDQGCLADTIRFTNAGIATDNPEVIKTFILSKYHEWQNKGFTRQPTLHREDFSRQQQCKKIETLL